MVFLLLFCQCSDMFNQFEQKQNSDIFVAVYYAVYCAFLQNHLKIQHQPNFCNCLCQQAVHDCTAANITIIIMSFHQLIIFLNLIIFKYSFFAYQKMLSSLNLWFIDDYIIN